jgi:hypothetical protein
MKSENYDELMDKFYAGKASAEDISILKGKGLLDDPDIFYAEALHSEREQKMDWDFEDLMNDVTATRVVALPRRSVRMKRMMAAAAVVAAILLAWIFWPPQDNRKEIVLTPVITKKVDPAVDIFPKAALPVDKVKDSALLSEDIKTRPPAIKNYTVKTRKYRPSKSSKGPAKDRKETTTKDDDFMVMVNGKRITDQADALAITKESLTMVSRDFTNMVDQLKPIGQIKIKL